MWAETKKKQNYHNVRITDITHDDAAYFEATTEELSVPHLTCYIHHRPARLWRVCDSRRCM